MNRSYRRILRHELREIGDPVVVATFMRSGTHLAMDWIRRQFPSFRSWKFPGEPLDSLYLPVDVLLPGWEPSHWSPERVRRVLRRPRRPVLKTHFLEPSLDNLRASQPDLADWLEERGTFLHVTRELRQLLPSLWAFLPDWQGTDPAAPLDETFVRTWTPRIRDHEAAWANRPGVRSLSHHAIVAHPEESLARLEVWLGERARWRRPLLPPPLPSRFHSRLARLGAVTSPSTAILARRPTPAWNPEWDRWIPPHPAPSCPPSSP
jgi:hypothetical protein